MAEFPICLHPCFAFGGFGPLPFPRLLRCSFVMLKKQPDLLFFMILVFLCRDLEPKIIKIQQNKSLFCNLERRY